MIRGVYYMTGAPEVFLVKPGIQPGLQGIALIHYNTVVSRHTDTGDVIRI